jgi:hypothetical protein
MEADTVAIVQAVAQVVYTGLTLLIVLYAAKQVHEANRTRKIEQYHAALAMMFEWRSDIIREPKLAERLNDPTHAASYFHKVIEHYGAENYFHTLKLFHTFEYLHLLKDDKVITSEMWEGWEKNLKLIMTSSDAAAIWADVKEIGIFHKEFAATMDRLARANPKPGTPSG